jgi:hypothetical protein
VNCSGNRLIEIGKETYFQGRRRQPHADAAGPAGA